MYIRIKVIAGARKEVVERVSSDHFNVSVKEPAERNMANTRVLEIVREIFPMKQVRMISGHHSPAKIVSVDE